MRSGVKHCIIIGAMKAGTTNLYTSLAKHPNICRARLKEPEFFSPYQSWRPYDSYESLWEVDPNIHLVTLEASTGYTKANSRETPRRMYEYGIRPYLIYILRNPFDRIESHFNFSARSLSIEFDSDIVDEELISPSDYMTHIDRYLEYFPRDRLLILDFAQLNHAKVEVMDSVFDFLGLDAITINEDGVRRNKTLTHMTPGEAWLRRKLNPVQRAMPVLKPLGRLVFSAVPKSAKKIELTQDERSIVKARLNPGMRRLRAEFDFDVEQWGF